ncbi:hypothetical protein AVEN_190770-1 [Araneus ventricosus]|uniref:Uncharacterized protein n=1 Tax=Araneus ventricosus TaxID=182803 RepID=A0A4Y2R933_ARAVE|nr:hypothetical protein AVEN_190770-1 [Araneus ventricosus]
MAAPKIPSIRYSAIFPRWQHYNSYSIATLPISKSVMHFIAQAIGAAICAFARSTRKCNYRFLDIQIVSNKLEVAPVVHRDAPSYSDVYKSVSTSEQREFLLSSG